MKSRVVWIDPYLSRNNAARPRLEIGPAEISEGSEIFLSHGHFDHAADALKIARRTGAQIHCSEGVAVTLRRHGIDHSLVVPAHDGDVFEFDCYRAQCFLSAHVRFDLRLLLERLWCVLPRLSALLPLLWDWPQGQVLTWRFTLAIEDYRVVQHFGTAGWTEAELTRLASLSRPDVLMVPLQGHTYICQLAAHAVERLRPRVAIPHHHDDFYPPISRMIDIEPFVRSVWTISPPVEVLELPLGQPVEI